VAADLRAALEDLLYTYAVDLTLHGTRCNILVHAR
jgi:hypothetical protein